MCRWLTLLPLCLLLAGCRAGSSSSGQGRKAPRVGPSLERLHELLAAPGRSEPDRRAYWNSVRGTLVSARGKVRQTSGSLLLEASLNSGAGPTACVVAYPDEARAGTLSGLHPDQPLGVQGELSDYRAGEGLPSGCTFEIVLRNARLIVR